MANFHVGEVVKSFHMTQTPPFIFTQDFCCKEQNTFEKTDHKNQEKELIVKQSYTFSDHQHNLKMLWKLGKIAGLNAKAKSKVLVSHRA